MKKFLLFCVFISVPLFADEESEALADLEAFIHRPIRLQVDGNFSQDRYEVVVS